MPRLSGARDSGASMPTGGDHSTGLIGGNWSNRVLLAPSGTDPFKRVLRLAAFTQSSVLPLPLVTGTSRHGFTRHGLSAFTQPSALMGNARYPAKSGSPQSCLSLPSRALPSHCPHLVTTVTIVTPSRPFPPSRPSRPSRSSRHSRRAVQPIEPLWVLREWLPIIRRQYRWPWAAAVRVAWPTSASSSG